MLPDPGPDSPDAPAPLSSTSTTPTTQQQQQLAATPHQQLATRRLYAITAATTQLNYAIHLDSVPELQRSRLSPPPDPFVPRFRFIASSWQRAAKPADLDEPLFKFTYYAITDFSPDEACTIASRIRRNADGWKQLLKYVSDLYRPFTSYMNSTKEFFLRAVFPHNAQPSPAELHMHLTHLQAATPVSDLLPGALRKYDDDNNSLYSSQHLRIHLLTVRRKAHQAPYPFDVYTVCLNSSRAHDWTIATHSCSDLTQQHPRSLRASPLQEAYWTLTEFLTLPDDSNDDICLLWIPVYEQSHRNRFHGRFLGWLYSPITLSQSERLKELFPYPSNNPPDNLRQHIESLASTCNTFAHDITESDAQTFLASLPDAPADNPQEHLKQLTEWEGWKDIILSDTRPDDLPENQWYHVTKPTSDRHGNYVPPSLHLRLDPIPHLDNPRDWGEYDKLGYISLRYRRSAAISFNNTDLQHHHLWQARRIRRILQNAARATRALHDAKNSEARRRAADFAHDITNYTDPLITFVATAADRYQKSKTLPPARCGLYFLNMYSHAIQDAFRGLDEKRRSAYSLPPDESTSVIDIAWQLLLQYHDLATQRMTIQRHGFLNGTPVAEVSLDDCIRKLRLGDSTSTELYVVGTIALFREPIQNIRVNTPTGEGPTPVSIDYNMTTHQDRITTQITQLTRDCHRAATDPSEGIEKSQRLFGPRGVLPIGDFRDESSERLPDGTVRRKITVDRFLKVKSP